MLTAGKIVIGFMVGTLIGMMGVAGGVLTASDPDLRF
jgi:hypothetical protein